MLILPVLILLALPAPVGVVSPISMPPSSLEAVVGGEAVIGFEVNVSQSSSTLLLLQVNYSSQSLRYSGFRVYVDGVEASDQFEASISNGTLLLSCGCLEPPEGLIKLDVIFLPIRSGVSTLSWRLICTAFHPPPQPPTILDRRGETEIVVSELEVSVNTWAVWHRETDSLDIYAEVICSICGEVRSGDVRYEIYTEDGGETGLRGSMLYNEGEGRWEALGIDTSNLPIGEYRVEVTAIDLEGHRGRGETAFTRIYPYTITIMTEGLPSRDHAVHLYVDGVDEGTLWDGSPLNLTLESLEERNITIQPCLIMDGVKYLCRNPHWLLTPTSDQSHIFHFKRLYLLTLEADVGEISAQPESPDGFYEENATIIIEAHPPGEGEWYWAGWRGLGPGSYTGMDNPAIITMRAPIAERARWIKVEGRWSGRVESGSRRVVEAAGVRLVMNLTGMVEVDVVRYSENPHPEMAPRRRIERCLDISISHPERVLWPIYLEVEYGDNEIEGLRENLLALYHWNGSLWIRCNETGVDVEENIVWAWMREEELMGSPIMIAEATRPIITLSHLVIVPEEAEPGEPVNIYLTISNNGGEGLAGIRLKINGVTETLKREYIGEGESKIIVFTVTRSEPGLYRVEVDGLHGLFTIKSPPPLFEVSNLTLRPESIVKGGRATIDVTVRNIGGSPGNHTITLLIDGVEYGSQTISLGAGESQTFSFEYIGESTGIHVVEIDGVMATIRVRPKIPPLIPAYIGLGATLILSLIALLYAMRIEETAEKSRRIQDNSGSSNLNNGFRHLSIR